MEKKTFYFSLPKNLCRVHVYPEYIMLQFLIACDSGNCWPHFSSFSFMSIDRAYTYKLLIH